MKAKRLLFLTLMALCATSAWAYNFSAVAPSGQTLYYNIVDGHAEVVRPGTGSTYNNYVAGDLIIPDTVIYNGNTYAVTVLATISSSNGAFYNCSGLTSVTIPNSVTSIRTYAFAYCSGLTSVTIPNSVTSIGGSAFYSCSGLTSVTIGNSVTSIGDHAFSRCSGLTSVTIPNSVTSIGYETFAYCSGLTSVTIPNSVTSIGNNAFAYCSGLTSVTIPNSMTSIGNQAFHGCSGLTSVTIPNSVTSIGNGAFYNCSGLTSVTIPNSVTSIGNGAFQYCSGLTSVTIPNSVTSLGNDAFAYCSGLTSVTIPNSVTSIGGWAFLGCSGLTSVTIPNSVTSIGDYAFRNCSGLTSVTIPNSVTSIGYETFAYCSGLTSVTIPNSVTSIGNYAFYNCSNLTGIWLKPTTPPSLGNAFPLGADTVPLVVPHNSYNAYTSAGASYTNHPIYRDSILVATLVNDTLRGYVTGGDTVLVFPYDNDTVTLTATANYGYHFVRWDDSSTDNPLLIVNNSGITRTAIFDFNQYNLTVQADTSIHGSCNGGGSYNYLSERTIQANASYGYHFTQWNDGDTSNPRIITLTQDTSFTAMFTINKYSVTGTTNDSTKGHVSGSATVDYLDTVTLTATPNYGYKFVRWSDNSQENPRRIVATANITKTAVFDFNQYNLTVQADTSIHGSCNGGGSYNYLSEQTILANANHGYHFTHWQDGDTNNPRTVLLTQDTSFIAYYDKSTYTLTFHSADTNKGIVNTVSVTGEYLDTTMLIYATALPHYHFVHWNGNNTENPRRFVIDNNRTYTAYFAIDVHNVNVQVDNIAHGTVDGSGSREYGQPITVSATSYSGYQFSHWSDGSTYNPYTFAVLEDKNLTAIFIADGEPWQDTVILYDTTYVILHDTAYINVPVHDTTYIDVPVHDTTIVTDTVTMTEYVPVHDTTYIDVPYPVHDTTTVHDTTYVDVPYPVHDTTYIDVHDTTYIDVPYAVHDTTYIDIHDTTYIDVPYAVHDTTYIDIHDTTYINVPYAVHDTTYINVHDTTTVIDTVTNYIYDTTIVHDTTLVTDTLWLTQYDTVWLHDTIIIHDTIVVGVADVDAINAKIYTSNGQIVVDGEGNTVWLYDVNGRILATKQDEYLPLYFDVPASGAYLVKIGNHPARKVVVIR